MPLSMLLVILFSREFSGNETGWRMNKWNKYVVIFELDQWWGFQVILKLHADFTLLGTGSSEFHRVGAMKKNT